MIGFWPSAGYLHSESKVCFFFFERAVAAFAAAVAADAAAAVSCLTSAALVLPQRCLGVESNRNGVSSACSKTCLRIRPYWLQAETEEGWFCGLALDQVIERAQCPVLPAEISFKCLIRAVQQTDHAGAIVHTLPFSSFGQ